MVLELNFAYFLAMDLLVSQVSTISGLGLIVLTQVHTLCLDIILLAVITWLSMANMTAV